MDDSIRPLLVRLGTAVANERYVGQGKTAAAHEFADAMLPVLQRLEDNIVKRIQEK